MLCNQEIARIEWLTERGYSIKLTPHQMDYLAQRPVALLFSDGG